ncbi:MAG: hypothetical protein COU72_03875, partial [Parcubacteria group bacterium CG10_big_fil_rev_8_21_14_0_10_41_35]
AGTSLFTSAWTESGFTGPEQSSFENYASAWQGSGYDASYWENFGQKAGATAIFGGEVYFTGLDLVVGPTADIAKLLKTPGAKLITAIPLAVVDNILPIRLAVEGSVGLAKTGLDYIDNLLTDLNSLAKITDDLTPAAEKGFSQLIEETALGTAKKSADEIIHTVEPSGTTYMINTQTLEVTQTGGNLWAKIQDSLDNVLPKKLDDGIDAAAKTLAELAEGKPEGYLNTAAKIRTLADAGIPAYKIDQSLLDQLDEALEKTLATTKIMPQLGLIDISNLHPHEQGYLSDTVRDLKKILEQGIDLDPIKITEYNGKIFTYDGANRVVANLQMGKTKIPYEFTAFNELESSYQNIVRAANDGYYMIDNQVVNVKIPDSYSLNFPTSPFNLSKPAQSKIRPIDNLNPLPFKPTQAPIQGNFGMLGDTRYRIEIEGGQTVDIHINNDQID